MRLCTELSKYLFLSLSSLELVTLICLASGLKMEHAHDLYIDPVGDSLAEQILLLHTHHYIVNITCVNHHMMLDDLIGRVYLEL